jgi:hypothetical protein
MFPRVESLIQACKAHLETTNSRGTEIESIFAGHLLVVIHSEFEQHILGLVRSRCLVASDPRLSSLMQYATGRLVRKITLSDLTSTLNTFHAECKQRFSDEVLDTEYHVSYDNIETNRQLIAHSSGINMTFDDVIAGYRRSLAVLDAFERALKL